MEVIVVNCNDSGFEAAISIAHSLQGRSMMPLSEFDTHSFVLKVWIEEVVEETGQATWRGYITHVQSGQRKYFERLEDVQTFIADYIRQLGGEVKTEPQFWNWLKRLQKRIDRG